MIRTHFLFPLLLAVTACLAHSADDLNTLTKAEKAEGWQLIFDGKSMKGWIDPAKKTPPGNGWTIEDGCLKSLPHPRITEDLVSERKFHDFELVWDWKIAPKGNSGLKYRIQDFVLLTKATEK